MARVFKDGKDKLIKDFHSVIYDSEELMKSVSDESGRTAQALPTKIEENLKQAKEYLEDFEDSVIDRSKTAAPATDEYVHENASQTIGLAIRIHLLIGILLNDQE